MIFDKFNMQCIVIACTLSLLTAGCAGLSQQAPPTEFYTFEYETPAAKGPKLPLVLRIEQITVAPVYKSKSLIYRDQEFQRKEYAYHKWRVSPGSMVTSFLSRDLRKSGLFKAVTEQGSALPCNYMLEGTLNKIYEKDLPQKWLAVLEIEITLLHCQENEPSAKIIFQRDYHREVKCLEKKPSSVVGALSQGMQEISGSVIKDIHEALKDRQ